LLLILISLGFLQHAQAQPPNLGSVIDTSITGFHYAIDLSGTSEYTEHGRSAINPQSRPTQFSVIIFQHSSFEQAKQQLSMLLRMSKLLGYEIGDFREKDTLVKGRPAYYVSYTETQQKKNYKNLVFNGVMSGDHGLLVFTSDDLEKGKFIDLFKKTFYQLNF
jgi:hypothetical protein